MIYMITEISEQFFNSCIVDACTTSNCTDTSHMKIAAVIFWKRRGFPCYTPQLQYLDLVKHEVDRSLSVSSKIRTIFTFSSVVFNEMT